MDRSCEATEKPEVSLECNVRGRLFFHTLLLLSSCGTYNTHNGYRRLVATSIALEITFLLPAIAAIITRFQD